MISNIPTMPTATSVRFGSSRNRKEEIAEKSPEPENSALTKVYWKSRGDSVTGRDILRKIREYNETHPSPSPIRKEDLQLSISVPTFVTVAPVRIPLNPVRASQVSRALETLENAGYIRSVCGEYWDELDNGYSLTEKGKQSLESA